VVFENLAGGLDHPGRMARLGTHAEKVVGDIRWLIQTGFTVHAQIAEFAVSWDP
jgi:hypothetical protein